MTPRDSPESHRALHLSLGLSVTVMQHEPRGACSRPTAANERLEQTSATRPEMTGWTTRTNQATWAPELTSCWTAALHSASLSVNHRIIN